MQYETKYDPISHCVICDTYNITVPIPVQFQGIAATVQHCIKTHLLYLYGIPINSLRTWSSQGLLERRKCFTMTTHCGKNYRTI